MITIFRGTNIYLADSLCEVTFYRISGGGEAGAGAAWIIFRAGLGPPPSVWLRNQSVRNTYYQPTKELEWILQ